DYLINKMRTLIFTTALPPINIEWTSFVLSQLEQFSDRREHLQRISRLLHDALARLGGPIVSSSHILPLLAGESREAVRLAGTLQDHGFYVLPVRPPTVPEGTSRLRFSLNANLTEEEIGQLITVIQGLT
ncbi:MAG: aminotransferase class I/II-fold pyridoxal phosphate-dependent enzyme, partial [Bacteroides sp.]